MPTVPLKLRHRRSGLKHLETTSTEKTKKNGKPIGLLNSIKVISAEAS
jgi:hypothetical protein